MHHDRSGFTLIELIAVTAIMAVLALVLTLSLSSVTAVRARSAVRTLDTMLSRCKTDCLSGRSSLLTLRCDSTEGLWYAELSTDGVILQAEELGSSKALNISAAVDDVPTAVTESAPFSVTFDGETGDAILPDAFGSGWRTCRLLISSRRGYTITINRITGSHELTAE